MCKFENNTEIKFVNSWSEGEIVDLYKAGGWWTESYAASGVDQLIKGSYAFAVVVDKKTGKTIGMGRIISDGASDAYIQDLIIIPEYRNKGIGKQLVQFLLKCCKDNGILWIGLIAEPDQDGFYSTIGFKQMKNYVPMKYEEDD